MITVLNTFKGFLLLELPKGEDQCSRCVLRGHKVCNEAPCEDFSRRDKKSCYAVRFLYIPIGEEFSYRGIRYKCIRGHYCDKCSLKDTTFCENVDCHAYARSDRNGVHFERV